MKFRLFPFGTFTVLFMDVLGFSLAIWFYFFYNNTKELWMYVVITIMCICYPIFFSVFFLSFSNDIIIISKDGIKRLHFGKVKRNIIWNDVKTVGLYPKSMYSKWIYISNHNVEFSSFWKIEFANFDKRVINIRYSKKVVNELNKYLPNGKRIIS